jgi:hypothetical protein
VWHAGGIGNNCNACLEGVGQLNHTGFIPKIKTMSTNTFSKETELRLTEFFNNSIDSKSMAKTIRQVNYTLALNVLKNETIQPENINLEDSFYWLNKLAEILDPYLEVE